MAERDKPELSESARQSLARRAIEALYEVDLAAQQFFGIKIAEVRPGYARVSLDIRPDMVNSHGICHGGVIFALADTAFAYACNTHNIHSLATHCTIDFLRPALKDTQLTAIATERSRGRQIGVYDVEVCDPEGRLVALFRGKSHATEDLILKDEPG